MITVFGDHHLSQHPGSGDAFVDDLRGDGRLDQCFTVITDPFATDMALDGKYCRCVALFLADVLTNALERAATWAVSVVWFVMDQRAWKLYRQCRAFRLLLFPKLRWSRLQGLKLSLNRGDIGIDQVIEQAGLLLNSCRCEQSFNRNAANSTPSCGPSVPASCSSRSSWLISALSASFMAR
jgi:hypothetical protein